MARSNERTSPRAAPGRLVAAGAPTQAQVFDEYLTTRLLALEFAAVVVFQKLAIPLGSVDAQVPVVLVIHYATLCYLLATGRAQIDCRRLVLLCAFAAAAVLTQAGAASGSFSATSLGLMLITSTILIVVVPLHQTSHIRVLQSFITLSMGAAILVFVDWLTQIAGLGMPNLESVLAPSSVYQEYVYLQPLQWNSPWLKPNGLFFLEASHVSQFIAMGLVVELAFFRRPVVIATTAAAVFLSYGGTGLIILALSLPVLMYRGRPAVWIWPVLIGLVVLVIAGSTGFLDAFFNRTAEFSQSNSSAYNRFILPVERFASLLQDRAPNLLFGTGAGTMPKAVNNLAELKFGLIWPPYVKVAVEYGIVTFLLWSLFLVSSLFGGGVPFVVAWAAFVQYQFLNGSLNVPLHTIYCWLLCAGYQIVDARCRRDVPQLPSPAVPAPLLAPHEGVV